MKSFKYSKDGFQKYSLSDKDLKNISGGRAFTNEPTYSLNDKAVTYLKELGYTLSKTGTGDYIIREKNNKAVEPAEIKKICESFN